MGNLESRRDVGDVKLWLSTEAQPWLLVFDNADDPSVKLSRFFPVSNAGSIIITSRNDETCVFANSGHLEIRPLSNEDAISLLLKTTRRYDTQNEEARQLAKSVVEDLGRLPFSECCIGPG